MEGVSCKLQSVHCIFNDEWVLVRLNFARPRRIANHASHLQFGVTVQRQTQAK
jgi:hypothetical protein